MKMENSNWRKEILMICINIFATMLAVVFVFQLWNKDIQVPISFQNDGLGAVATVKSMIEGEGIWQRSYWSAPFGEANYMVDYILPLAFIKIITLFVKDAAVVINIFWGLTYVLTAITTYLLLRKLNVRYSVAILGSIIYNFLPYHYFRIEHFWLCGCYIIPLAIWLILDAMGIVECSEDKALFAVGKLKITKRVLINAIICILIGLNGIYYAVFTAMLILIMSFFRAIGEKRIKCVLTGLYDTCIIFIPIILFYVCPTLLWGNSQMGDAGATRSIYDIERYALKIMALFFPVQGHRVQALADFTEYYSEVFNLNNESFTVVLGFIMSVGLIISLVSLFCKKVFGSNGKIITGIGQVNVVIMLIACQGGLAGYIGVFLTSAIRCFNRLSIFIAMGAIIVVCVILEAFLNKKQIKRIGEIIIVGGLLIFGVLDQTSEQFGVYSLFNPGENEYQLSYIEKEADYYQLSEYFSNIQEELGDGSTIYMLPRNPYYGDTNTPFAPIKAYVCSEDLNWSYSEWNAGYKSFFEKIEMRGTEALLNTISLVDMSGIMVDKESYASEEEFKKVCMEIENLTGEDAYIDEGEQLYFYNINSYKENYLEQYTDDELEVMRSAITDQVEGIEISAVDVEELYLLNEYHGREFIVESDDMQFGPYVDLKAGTYQVTVVGENLDKGTARVTSQEGRKQIEISNIEQSNHQMTYEFTIESDEIDVEFLMNGGTEDITIEAYYYEKNTGNGFHDLLEYYEGIVSLEKAGVLSEAITLTSKDLYVSGHRIAVVNDEMILHSGEEQYGPYFVLEKGEYVVRISGENLEDVAVGVGYNFREDPVAVTYVEKEENTIIYEFELKNNVENIELVLINNGKQNVKIDSYICTRTTGNETQIELLEQYQ